MNNFKICRSSEVEEEDGKKRVSYQIFSFYMQKIGMIKVEEYTFCYNDD
jgi:hypothetical protein